MLRQIHGVQLARKIMQHSTFSSAVAPHELLDESLLSTEKNDLHSKEYIEGMVRKTASTIYHPVGTTKMGRQSDPMAVVDPQLRVYGIKGEAPSFCKYMSADW